MFTKPIQFLLKNVPHVMWGRKMSVSGNYIQKAIKKGRKEV
jgi:hypothetical protein